MSPALEAAFRLACSLPKTTHFKKPPVQLDRLGKMIHKQHPAKKKMSRGKGVQGKSYGLRVGGEEFSSITQAAKILHKSTRRIYEMLDLGLATPVSQHSQRGRPLSIKPVLRAHRLTGRREG